MGYCEDDSMVRVDFFKESGKWYTTEAIEWIGWKGDNLIHDAFYASLKAALGDRLGDMMAVCIEPYHEHAHPIMINAPWRDYQKRQEEATEKFRLAFNKLAFNK